MCEFDNDINDDKNYSAAAGNYEGDYQNNDDDDDDDGDDDDEDDDNDDVNDKIGYPITQDVLVSELDTRFFFSLPCFTSILYRDIVLSPNLLFKSFY